MSLLSAPNNQRIISKYVQTKLTLYIKVLCYKHTILSLEDAIVYMTIWFPFHLVFCSKFFYIKCESMDHLSNHLIPVIFVHPVSVWLYTHDTKIIRLLYLCPSFQEDCSVVALGWDIHHARPKNICQRADHGRARVCPLVCVRRNILILSLSYSMEEVGSARYIIQ